MEQYLNEGDRVRYYAMDDEYFGTLRRNNRYGHPSEWYLELDGGDRIVIEDLNEVYK